MKQELTVRKKIRINAPVLKVWEALIKPEWTKKYMFGCEAISDWEQGSKIVFSDFIDGKPRVQVKGTIVDIEPPKRLSYTCFGPLAGVRDIPSNYTIVTYELAPQDDQTQLEVTQGDFSAGDVPEQRYYDADRGWEFALNKMKEMLEGEEARSAVRSVSE